MDRDEEDFVFGFETKRDIPLSLQWQGVTDDNLHFLRLGHDKYSETMRRMLAQLIVVGRHAPGQLISYSRNTNHYTGRKRYEGQYYSHDRVIRSVAILAILGLVEEQRAKRGSHGIQSRIRASRNLIECTRDWGPFFPELYECIRLKDEKKKWVDYVDTDVTCQMRGEMETINAALVGVEIDYDQSIQPLDFRLPLLRLGKQYIAPYAMQLYRSFNVDFDHGGRAYGGFWQNMPGDDRIHLLLDGCSVTEPDYRNMHAVLSYALHGTKLVGDAYNIAGFERPLVKDGFQMLINAGSRRGALLALCKKHRSLSHAQADAIMQQLERRHAAIARSFYTSVGRKLQKIDSNLMVNVLFRCLDAGFIGLPVHDSIIVKTTDHDAAEGIMAEELELMLRLLSGRSNANSS